MIWFVVLMQVLEVSVYRFESGYVELWYQLPIAALVDSHEFKISQDSVSVSCIYTFSIRSADGTDSALVEGNKTTCVYLDDLQDFIIDYLPLNLYPGSFLYDFLVKVKKGSFQEVGNIEIPEEIVSLSCSDLVLGREGFGQFVYRGVVMLPSINANFTPTEKLCSYLELYGLVPDSLSYSVEYRIRDYAGAVVKQEKREILKYDYMQVDTHIVDLSTLVPGKYSYVIEVDDPSSGSNALRGAPLTILAVEGIAEREFYHEIQYVISSNAFDKFRSLSDVQQEIYLKEFWSQHDYWQFERRLIEADKMFSVGSLLGRDSERGRLYIMLGPPDEIETMSIENWARPFDVWHYYGRNDFLFSDVRNDHNPRLIKVLRPGELTDLLNTGMREGSRDEEWLSDIAPGTYDWYEDKTNPQ
jgi:GWxTD domain-containing protein